MTDERVPLGGSQSACPSGGGEEVPLSLQSRDASVTGSPLPSGGSPGWAGARDGRSAETTDGRSAGARSATYIELHAHSAYSFLDGASLPEELAARAAELGYDAF